MIMRSKIIGLLIALLLSAILAAKADGYCTLTTTCPDNDILWACSPGWPSGWWRSDCRGPDGGWAALRNGCVPTWDERITK
jgi:hypothetical protein